MFTRHLEIMVLAALTFCVSGCHSVQEDKGNAPSIVADPRIAKFSIELPNFRTLDELEGWYESQGFTKKVYVFERGETRVAIVRADWGSGDSWDAIYIYACTGSGNQWVPRVVWNTETRNAEVTYSEETGIIQIRSGKAVPIFAASITVFAARQTRDW